MAHNSNLLLASLSPSDTAALQPHLKSVHLEQGRVLVEAGATPHRQAVPRSRGVSLSMSSGWYGQCPTLVLAFALR